MVCGVAAKLNKSVFFLGGFEVADKAAQKMQQKFPTLKIAGTLDGDPKNLNKICVQSNPDILLVAFGAPTQEFWIQKFAPQIPSLKLAIGVGGTFDFWAGKVRRAPKFLRTIGLEWLWRLFQEPIKRFGRIFRAVIVIIRSHAAGRSAVAAAAGIALPPVPAQPERQQKFFTGERQLVLSVN